MAVLENNSEGSSVPREVVQNLEVDDDYNKNTPSADCNSFPGWNMFRTKKFTKKRHESKSRRTDRGDPSNNVCCSDEDYPQASSKTAVESPVVQRSIPTMMMTINQTIQKMSLKEEKTGHGCSAGNVVVKEPSENIANDDEDKCGISSNMVEPESGVAGSGVGDSAMSFEIENDSVVSSSHHHQPQDVNRCSRNNNSSCNLPHPQGKRRRHRRKQQYKRMAVDVQNDKMGLQLKVPTSNSSEDSGIGKRKRNIIFHGNKNTGQADVTMKAIAGPSNCFASTSQHHSYQQQFWQLEPDNDAVMMEYDELEASGYGQAVANDGIFVTEEESGESDAQNDDVESFSDHNQDADDEESDYYNNDSSTTSLSESSFTILNPSKKFIPVHSREIRSGRRRLKNSTISSIENEELSRFLQSPMEPVLKLCPSSEKERQDFKNIASLYSLSYEEGFDPEDKRVWVQFTKTVTTTTQQQRRNEIFKAVTTDRSPFPNITEGATLVPLYDKLVTEKDGENSDDFIDEMHGTSNGNNMSRGGLGVSQLVNSKRIKKGC